MLTWSTYDCEKSTSDVESQYKMFFNLNELFSKHKNRGFFGCLLTQHLLMMLANKYDSLWQTNMILLE
ncbi:hypothetical protein Fmac_001422 [Flemingia macrophylla]|uniref:Uncharacterized protein n=1 Tax=Flemingia macrophylla TaxID=520843 RepID=A0ABD1NH22_9FABA